MENMKVKEVMILILPIFSIFSCNQNPPKTNIEIQQTEIPEQIENTNEVYRLKDKEEIQNLIRKTLKWADSKDAIELLPMLTDNQDSIYIGFDLTRHQSNLDKLRATDFFAEEFIENYNQIILTLDRKMKNHEFVEWFVGDLPTFRFANGSSPWCDCQDVPYDNPNPWDYVEIEVIELNGDRAQLIWRWGEADLNINSDWLSSFYKFRTVKENGKWKIAFLQEFDFEESTRT